MEKFDFKGWATKNDLQCSDGRIIRKDAFKHNDGQVVPLVWNHDHTDPYRIVGHVKLENRPEGVYAYGKFNDTDLGQTAKVYVQHGDITQLSIYANQLKQQGPNVMHGSIREVSLVLSGANPGAYIESVMVHGEESGEEAMIFTGEDIELVHNDDTDETLEHSEDESSEKKDNVSEIWKRIQSKLSEDELNVVYAFIASAGADGIETNETEHSDIPPEDTDVSNSEAELTHSEENNFTGSDEEELSHSEKEELTHSEGGNTMKTNVFDKDTVVEQNVLTHADQEAIIALAKSSGVGSLQDAIKAYAEQNSDRLAHGFETEALTELLPDVHNLNPGAPDIVGPDQSWVTKVINKIHKSPYARIRTRQADARIADMKAKGYQNKGDEKKLAKNLKLIGRKTEPQTIYVKDEMHRDDIIDITDFDVVAYNWGVMKNTYLETVALAVLVGDQREDADPDKIHQENVRSVLNDDDLYAIHKDVDVEEARTRIQGTNTAANFSENYIYAEAMIEAALYAREQYKGTGTPDYYCAPHSINIMLLARDLNGRRIYDSKADLAKALNVGEIIEIEQLEGVTRKTEDGETKKLHGIFVNLADYTIGATRGGQLAKFDDFDIDFNKYKYLLEGRASGALTKPFAAIVLEEPVTAEG